MHNKITFGPAGYTYDEIIKMALGIVQSFASFGVTDLPDTAKHCMNLGQKLTSEYNRLDDVPGSGVAPHGPRAHWRA
ncbi:hypothetical protein, partial [Seohaeicola zhoushanensis]|uniref:hypothetical protein n=1 Tax=Seohaeicola zhoushanensis TaxID=1569283 RepID=UPI001E58962B